MSDKIFENVAGEIAMLHNQAFENIQNGNMKFAKQLYINSAHICELFEYKDGISMTCLNLANLCILENDLGEALEYGNISVKSANSEGQKKQAADFMATLCKEIVKKAVEMEKKGELSNALELLEKVEPYVKGKIMDMVKAEIVVIKEVIGNERSNDSGRLN